MYGSNADQEAGDTADRDRASEAAAGLLQQVLACGDTPDLVARYRDMRWADHGAEDRRDRRPSVCCRLDGWP